MSLSPLYCIGDIVNNTVAGIILILVSLNLRYFQLLNLYQFLNYISSFLVCLPGALRKPDQGAPSLLYFILFYFILFYFILFYFTLLWQTLLQVYLYK